MSKLQNDKVSFELDLRATKAQEEIHRLTKATEELRRQNAAHRSRGYVWASFGKLYAFVSGMAPVLVIFVKKLISLLLFL